MNIELKPRRDLFPVPAPAPANDNSGRVSLSRRHVVIYQTAKSAMTSGRAGTKRWLLEYESQSAPFIEPLMGWTGNTDPMGQVRLSFPSREAAVAYAERQGFDYEVRESARLGEVRIGATQSQSRPMHCGRSSRRTRSVTLFWSMTSARPLTAPYCGVKALRVREKGGGD